MDYQGEQRAREKLRGVLGDECMRNIERGFTQFIQIPHPLCEVKLLPGEASLSVDGRYIGIAPWSRSAGFWLQLWVMYVNARYNLLHVVRTACGWGREPIIARLFEYEQAKTWRHVEWPEKGD